MDDRATEEWNRLARALCELAEVFKAERDALRSEVARLTAEVEAMREVVEAARETTTTRAGEMLPVLNRIYLALADLDALRARKVGG